MCRSMVDIQSPTAEIKRGKKEEEEEEDRQKEITGQKYNGLPITQGDHNYGEQEVVPGLSNELQMKCVRYL